MLRDQWKVFIEDHHAEYITKARWANNVEKIEGNNHARGATAKRSLGKGVRLLAGLLRCSRCGHRRYVSYAKSICDYCRDGAPQRWVKRPQCFSFAGSRIDQRVIELLLDVVRPAGIEVAQLAAK